MRFRPHPYSVAFLDALNRSPHEKSDQPTFSSVGSMRFDKL